MPNDLLKSINELISKNIGDIPRLEHIKITLEKGKELFQSDSKYVQNLIESHQDEIDSKQHEKSDLGEKLQEAEKKIEKLEKQSQHQEERDYQSTFYKSEGTTLVLSIVLGLLGINGVGHIYVGKVGKGIFILIGSIVLFGIGVATIYFGVGAIFLIIYFIVFIWQIVDSRKLCQQFNSHIREVGNRPW